MSEFPEEKLNFLSSLMYDIGQKLSGSSTEESIEIIKSNPISINGNKIYIVKTVDENGVLISAFSEMNHESKINLIKGELVDGFVKYRELVKQSEMNSWLLNAELYSW